MYRGGLLACWLNLPFKLYISSISRNLRGVWAEWVQLALYGSHRLTLILVPPGIMICVHVAWALLDRARVEMGCRRAAQHPS